MIGPRHTTIDADAARGARENSENWRDTREALKRKLSGSLSTVAIYTATGSTSTKIRVFADSRPSAVVLVCAASLAAPSASLAAVPILNFAWDSTSKALDVFEPSGLSANTQYTLTFLVLEA